MNYYNMLRKDQDKEQARVEKQSTRISKVLQGQLKPSDDYIINSLKARCRNASKTQNNPNHRKALG